MNADLSDIWEINLKKTLMKFVLYWLDGGGDDYQ